MECNLIKMMKKQLSFIEVKMILIPFCLQMFEWILFYIGTMEIHGLSQKKVQCIIRLFRSGIRKKNRKWKEIFTFSPSSDVQKYISIICEFCLARQGCVV